MYMERGKRVNALGMDSFDRAIEYTALDALNDEMESGSISALCSSVSPLTYTASNGGTGFNSIENTINSITLDGKQLTI